MRIFGTLGLAAGFALMGGAAFAWGDMYMGDGTNDPNSNFLMHSYNAPNHCPAGLQPVTMGGVICCGTPNAGPYVDRPGKASYKPKAKPAYRPRAYAPVGEKGVVYR
ncbi:hypothetical protein [Tropicibacter oceani]|uniref:Uncharacterized protein n=1 Tax=Tropicibacter oceani TaxID=3058420 RepID=A0ABY8QLC8_9RHOB|nr:hypothetical protein [Tropicibacter oceani]WGW05444.1 hypothetical protein QF118_07820 [Tropicibacter oceani]